MPKRLTTEEFIKKAKKIHGDKYDYIKVDYHSINSPVEIICPIHGRFTQKPSSHLNGHDCYECGKIKNKEPITHTKDNVINRFFDVHGYKYDYSKVDYINANTDIIIICPEHGEFQMKPSVHYREKRGCVKCKPNPLYGKLYHNRRTEKWISNIKSVWGNDYFDFSETEYINTRTNINVKCNKHQESFHTKPMILSSGKGGCYKCIEERYRKKHKEKMTPTFIKKASKIHGNYYDYSLVDYHNSQTPVKIICPIHGIFEQLPNCHINEKCGCQMCSASSGERRIAGFLNQNDIDYTFNKFIKIDNCNYYFDFFLNNLNIAIEFDGKQHFKPIKFYGGKDGYLETIRRDDVKNRYCQSKEIKMIRIPYYDFDNIENILENALLTTPCS